MSQRRSTRAASEKPQLKPQTKPATRPPRSQPAKRQVDPERSVSPPPKRKRSESEQSEQSSTQHRHSSRPPSSKPSSRSQRTTTTAAGKPHLNGLAPVHEDEEMKPYFNPIPPIPAHTRPAPQLFAWGAGNFGQFGMGPDFLGEFGKPKKNMWIEEQINNGAFGGQGAGIEAVAAGGLHTLFIDEQGTVWSCGVNDDAALGRITKDVPDPNNPGKFLDVDELTAVPLPLQTLIDEGFRAVRVAAGDSISAAISSEGELRVWGSFRANEGLLGFADGQKHQFTPTSILSLPHKPGHIEKVVSVASGNNHLLILTTSGNIYALGAGEQGQLGRKVLERRKIHGTVPEKITLGTRSRKAVIIGAGNYHSFAVDDQGDVWGWGLNTMGQTGTGVMGLNDPNSIVQLPMRLIGLSKEELGTGETVVQIAGGEHHTLFLTSAGRVFACGRCDGGQLGLDLDNPTFTARPYNDFIDEPVEVTFPTSGAGDPIVHISVGTHNNAAISAGGALYSWGEGNQGELGVGEDKARTPTVVVRREGGSWTALAAACGGQHTLGLFRKKT